MCESTGEIYPLSEVLIGRLIKLVDERKRIIAESAAAERIMCHTH